MSLNHTVSSRRIEGQIDQSGSDVGTTLPNQSVQTNSENILVSIPNTGTGDNVLQTSPTLITPSLGFATASEIIVSGLTASRSVRTDGSKKLVSVANTGTGNNVLQTSPVLVTPDIGIATGTDLTLTGLGANQLVQTDANKKLISAVNTGSGSIVLQNSPTLITPDIGIATGSDLTLSGLTASQSVQTDSLKKLVSVANTGTGNNVLQTSPTLVTPTLGIATGTDLTLSGLTANQSVQTDANKKLVSVANTGTGNNVLQTSPVLVTPNLGVAIGTDLTLSGLTAFRSVQTDGTKKLITISNTGSGSNVLATSPTLVTPALGAATATSITATGQISSSKFQSTGFTGNHLDISSSDNSTSKTTGCATFTGGIGVSKTITCEEIDVFNIVWSGGIPSRSVQTNSLNKFVAIANTGIGNNVLATSPVLVTPNIGIATGTDLTLNGLSPNQLVQTDANRKLISATSVGSGSIVLQNSPSLTTPDIGIATGTDLTLSGLTANQSVQTDGTKKLVSVANTGTGSNVLATSPVLVTPTLGVATGTDLTLSGLTASQSVQTDGTKKLVSVANTGTGNNVLQTSPTLVTPNLGVATATSLSIPTITNLSLLNGSSFAYESGTFTPTFTSWAYNPQDPQPFTTTSPWTNLTIVTNSARYVKLGPSVTVYVNLVVSYNGQDNVSTPTLRKIPLVRNLPYALSTTFPSVRGSGTVRWPNNRFLDGDIITPGATSYENMYPILYSGEYYPIPGENLPVGNIDGKSVVFECTRRGWNILGAEIFSQERYPIENIHMGLVGQRTSSFIFSLTYYTDV